MATHPTPEGIIFAPEVGPEGGIFESKGKAPGVGTVLFGRYKLQRILGRGGMGVVWLAEDLKLERAVALKSLPILVGLDPAAVRELKIETRRGLELSHPNIVRIYDFVDDEAAAAISMEYVDGKTLTELRMSTEAGVFTVGEVSSWLAGVCEALDYAHFHRQLVHRDLKPANIMVNTAGVPKIADFGIARSLVDTMSRLSAARMAGCGTLPYMSPQQAMGEKPLPSDDVYSLAATVYEMLAGKPPFYRGDLPTQITSKVPPRMVDRRAELEIESKDIIPENWERGIALALHKDPAMRPQSAGALADLLGIQVASVAPRTITYGTQPGTPVADKPRNGLLLLAVSAIAAIATAGIIWIATEQSAVRKPASAGSASSDQQGAKAPSATSSAPIPDGLPPPSENLPTRKAKPDAKSTVPPVPIPVPVPVESAPPPSVPASSPTSPVAMPAPGTELPTPPPTAVPVPPTQPLVVPPPAGFWELAQIFPTAPQADFSENGKRYLLYLVQSALKKEGLYTATLDGKQGKSTHNAIVLFQVRNNLQGHGLLDEPTLTALGLIEEEDKADWSPPAETRRRRPPEKPGFLDRMKKMFR